MKSALIYLDHAATTPADPAVVEAMVNCLGRGGAFGNTGSDHAYGAEAATAVEEAREAVAALVGARCAEIVWTSSATESNNLAVKGAARYARARSRGHHVVTIRTEHKSVLSACEQLAREGFDVDYLPVRAEGSLDLDLLRRVLRDDTVLVSAMHVNNETGVVHDIAAVAALVHEKGALLHVDAVQSAGKLPVDVQSLNADLLSLSAHKYYGPKGVGALYVRRRPRVRIEPIIHGGGQEGGMRSGTVATHQVVGMGVASRLAAERLEEDAARLRRLRRRLWVGLSTRLPGIRLNGREDDGAPHILNVAFGCVHGEALAEELGNYLAVSGGSACTALQRSPSYVLKAMGCHDQLAFSSVRFSLGRTTTASQIDEAVLRVTGAVNRLRAISPLWARYQAGDDLDTVYGRDSARPVLKSRLKSAV